MAGKEETAGWKGLEIKAEVVSLGAGYHVEGLVDKALRYRQIYETCYNPMTRQVNMERFYKTLH